MTPLPVRTTAAAPVVRPVRTFCASLAPHFVGQPRGRRTFAGYLFTTEAVSVATGQDGDGARDRISYYLGAALTPWVVYQVGTVLFPEKRGGAAAPSSRRSCGGRRSSSSSPAS